MRNLVLILLLTCTTLTACTSPSNCNLTKFASKFDCQVDKAKKYCLNQGFIGHEPEYRSCVIRKSSKFLNLNI